MFPATMSCFTGIRSVLTAVFRALVKFRDTGCWCGNRLKVRVRTLSNILALPVFAVIFDIQADPKETFYYGAT